MRTILSAIILTSSLVAPIHASPVLSKVATVSQAVTLQKPDGTSTSLKPGSAILPGSVLATGKDGEVTFVPVPGALIKLGANSQLRVVSADVTQGEKRSAKLTLASGSLSVTQNGGALQIALPSGGLTKKGDGAFAITLSAEGELLLVVATGSVSLTAGNGRTVTVGPGEFVSGQISKGFSGSRLAAEDPAAAQLLASIDLFASGATSKGVGTSRGGSGLTTPVPGGRALETAANPANVAGSINSNEQ